MTTRATLSYSEGMENRAPPRSRPISRALVRRAALPALWVATLTLAGPGAAAPANRPLPRISRAPKVAERIRCLSFSPIGAEAFAGGAASGVVTLRGRCANSADSSLLLASEPVELRPPVGSFVLKIAVERAVTLLHMKLIKPDGAVETETLTLQVPGLRAGAPTAAADSAPEADLDAATPVTVRASIGVALTSLKYSETDQSDYRSYALTPKAAITLGLVPDEVEVGVSAFGTASTLSASSTSSELRFFGLNLRAAYLIPFGGSGWLLSLQGGWYYFTTFARGAALGFNNLSMPQIFPVLLRKSGSGQVISGYFKFSPIVSAGESLNFANRELAGGLSYAWPIRWLGTSAIALTLDLSSLVLTDAASGIRGDARTTNLGIRLDY